MTSAAQDRSEDATWGLWGTLVWSLIIGGAFVLAQTIVLIVMVAVSADGQTSGEELEQLAESFQSHGTVLALSTYASMLVGVLTIFGAIKLKSASIRRYLALTLPNAKTFLLWGAITLAFIVLSDGLTSLLGKPIVPEFMVDVVQTSDSVVLLVGALVIAAPLFEELFFRGFMFAGLSNSFLGNYGAILVTAALWAGIHLQYDLYGIGTIFVMGLMFGLARLRTGSTVLTMALHAMVNCIATAQALWLY